MAAITGLAVLLGQTWQIGVAVGCILALSSTAIVLQTFSEKNLLPTPGGQAGFAVLLFQDVAANSDVGVTALVGSAVVKSDHSDVQTNLFG